MPFFWLFCKISEVVIFMKRKKYYKKIFEYFKDKKILIIKYIILALLISGISFFNPYINSRIIVYITNFSISKLLLYSFLTIILGSMVSLLRNSSYHVGTRIRNSVSLRIKEEASKELFNIEVKNFDKEGTSYFTSIINSEPETIAGIFDSLQYSITGFFTNIGVFIYIFIISWQIGILFTFLMIINAILSKKRMTEWKKINSFLKDLDSKYSSNFSELVRGIRDIKVLNLKKNLLKKTIYEQENYKKESYEFDKKQDRRSLYFSIVDYVSDFLIILLGVFLVWTGKLTSENLLIIYMYRYQASDVFRNAINIYEQITRFNFSIDRLYGLIDGEKYSKEKFGKKSVKLSGNILVKNLFFSYGENEVLKDVSFEIKANTTVGFVGKSGQGKTTVFNVLSKLYTVDDNMIFYDGIDINELSEKSLRDSISEITQNPYIFNMSIKDNLRIVNSNLTEKEMIKVCKMCELHNFIMTLPQQYDTLIGENGITLSGGQRQRLAIARSIVKKSNIILFDEATSSLDNETQNYIQDSIHKLSNKYTILIIAHRLSTVRDCDKIFFIDNGKIIASGTHDELVNSCAKYRNLYKKELK